MRVFLLPFEDKNNIQPGDKVLLRATLLLLSIALAGRASAFDIAFTDVANSLGINYFGQSFGQSWGDYDKDGFADLYISNHGFYTTIYKNNNGTSFTDMQSQLNGDLIGDVHAGAWGDFDNDGDRDLLFLEGGSSSSTNEAPSRFMVNDNGTFTDQASIWGLEQPFARARTPSWFDWNHDGLLDVAQTNWARSDDLDPSAVFTRQGNIFVNSNDDAGYHPQLNNNFATLVKTNTQAEPVLLVNVQFGFPQGMFDMSQLPFVDISQSVGMPNISATYDFAAADFDGDLEQEIYFARRIEFSEVVQVGPNKVQSNLNGVSNSNYGFSFVSDGPVNFNIGPTFEVSLESLVVGSSGFVPASLDFTLDATDPNSWDTPLQDPSERAMYVFYDTATDRWQVEITHTIRPTIIIDSTTAISDVQTIDFTSTTGERTPLLLKQTGSGYQNIAPQSGLTEDRACYSVAAADYDNDMDVDIFLACTSGAINRENILMENDGTGQFTKVIGAAGATGTTFGRSDTATAADFNNDGFMDLLVTNGAGTPPIAPGPTELFQNGGNTNHWVHINLEGVQANRDGIGSWVVLTAGGVSQSRLQSNGIKRFGQDDQRLHFGLGSNTMIDEIVVRWPGGNTQSIANVGVDQILTITEEVDTDGDGLLDGSDNCIEVSNSSQIDADGDGFGNVCDTDLNNDQITNFLDLGLFTNVFLTNDAVADFNSDGSVSFLDFAILVNYFMQPPGP